MLVKKNQHELVPGSGFVRLDLSVASLLVLVSVFVSLHSLHDCFVDAADARVALSLFLLAFFCFVLVSFDPQDLVRAFGTLGITV